MQSSILFVALSTLVAVSAGAAPSPAPTDLSWLANLPGVELGKSTRVGNVEQTNYTVTGDLSMAYSQLAQAFVEHGWVVRRSRGLSELDTDPESADLRSLRATIGAAAVRVLARRAAGRHTLLVLMERAAAPAGRQTAQTAASASASNLAFGGRIEVKEDGTTRSLACTDFDSVAVLGNRNRLTVTGACDSLEVLGNGNQVEVRGSVDQIAALGQGNAVTWSSAGNPVPPRTGILGRDDSIEPMAEAAPTPTPAPAAAPARKPVSKTAAKPAGKTRAPAKGE